MTALSLTGLTYNSDGLIPAIVQDADTSQVLMMAWMNATSIAATAASGFVTFWSRSRDELWEKGATSGNRLHLVDLTTDCDADTLLVLARPTGPACHTGAVSCFADAPTPEFGEFGSLWQTISQRSGERTKGSYTVSLLSDPELAARKVLEEAGEVAFAAKDMTANTSVETRDRLVSEAADLSYHLLVLLKAHGIDISAVTAELASRR